MRKTPLSLLLLGAAFALPAQALVFDFSNTTAFTIPGSGTEGLADPASTPISVSGVTGAVTGVTASLFGLSHERADDLDILLVGPTGVKVLLMSDNGGNHEINAIDLTFDDSAASSLPNNSVPTSGSYRPSDWNPGEGLQDFGLSGSAWGLLLSAFDGLDPNGGWGLYIRDDHNHDIGALSGGWALSITTDAVSAQELARTAVPEPASLALLGLGWAGLIAVRRKAR